ncbi:glycine-rich cell wall structural protein 1-like [Cucumis melo var. makuwa]|uniref:Glycine-rich cell wall structural protein 1-like n=1 Tax=Cucumis melo var. makuwa TaxID=1194695 RepID=A0A5A7TIR0_CUCMM|nr:glycine-rich cell wall structural protein 1-like [Cucumis melo var. makuwa]TYK16032.1 glycine-rich cell wall structural protein 1-like [Cucumis melo var. makuwa]
MKHSLARNVIERAFGILKGCWAILRGKSYYPLQSHLVVKGLLNKLFPYYNELAYAFGHDRAMGRFVETFTNVGSIEPVGYEGFDMPYGMRSFHQCTVRGLTSPGECTRTLTFSPV